MTSRFTLLLCVALSALITLTSPAFGQSYQPHQVFEPTQFAEPYGSGSHGPVSRLDPSRDPTYEPPDVTSNMSVLDLTAVPNPTVDDTEENRDFNIGLEFGLAHNTGDGVSYDYIGPTLEIGRLRLQLTLYEESSARHYPADFSIDIVSLEGQQRDHTFLTSVRWGFEFLELPLFRSHLFLESWVYFAAALEMELSELKVDGGDTVPRNPSMSVAAGLGLGTDLSFPFRTVTEIPVLRSLGVRLSGHVTFMQSSFEIEELLVGGNDTLWLLGGGTEIYVSTNF